MGGLVPVAADRRLDPALPRLRPAAHERLVASLESPPPDEVAETPVRVLRARDDEQARRVAVEPVHDPRALRSLTSAQTPEQAVHERAGRVSGRRVDDDAGGLVDNEEVLVLVGDPER